MSDYSEGLEMKIFPMMLSSSPFGMESKSSLVMHRKPPIMRLNSTGEEHPHFPDKSEIISQNKPASKGVFHRLVEQKCKRKPLYSPQKLGISPCLAEKLPHSYMIEGCANIKACQSVSENVMCTLIGGTKSTPNSKMYKIDRVQCPGSFDKRDNKMDTSMTNLQMSSNRAECIHNVSKNLGITPIPKDSSASKKKLNNNVNTKCAYSSQQSIVVKCNSLFSTPTENFISERYSNSNPTCDVTNKSQRHCDDKSNSLIVHISAQCQGEAKFEVNISKGDTCVSSETEQNKDQCSESAKKKRKPRPSCKKRRRLQMQKENSTNEKKAPQKNCAFSFVMGWTSPSKNNESCQKHLNTSPENTGSKKNKFSFFISGADFSDSSSDDGFSESDDNTESQCDEDDDVWNSFIHSSDPFSPFNLQCVFHLGPNKTATASNNCDQNEIKDPVIQKKLRNANESWQKLYQTVVPNKRNSKVQFAPVNQLESVNHIDQYCAEYAEARQGPWEQIARDRQRFQKRIQEVETSIGHFFTASHREIVFNRLYGDLHDVC